MPESEMIDFQEALGRLSMSEAELQNLVARGDLKAFRSGGTMKFRAEDIDGLKKERETEPTIIIPPGEPSMEDSGPIAIDLGEGTARAPAPAAAAPESYAAGTEDIAIEEPALEILPTDEGTEVQSAEEITIIAPDAVGAEPTGSEAEITIVDEEAAVPAESIDEQKPMAPDRRSVSARVSSIRHRAVYEQAPGHPIMSAVMALTAAVMLFTVSVFVVIMWKDVWRPHYGVGGGERFVPAYLKDIELKAEKWAEPQPDTKEGGKEGDTGGAAAPAP
jgi:hypothetical protein